MKILVRKISIATLSVLLAVFSLLGGFYLRKGVRATAAATEIDAKALITASQSTTIASENGVRVSSDGAYSGKIQGVFQGDTAIKFTFPETLSAEEVEAGKPTWWDGSFVVRVTDASDDSKYFEVAYYNGAETYNGITYHYTNAVVEYNGMTRVAHRYNPAWSTSRRKGDYNIVAPTFRSYYGATGSEADRNTREGVLSFVWTDDKLSIKVNSCGTANAAALYTLATFDGTEAEGFVSGTSWGLPKMNFENGYVISFSSSFNNGATTDKATDVCFKEIETEGVRYDLTTTSVVRSDFYDRYENWQKSNVSASLNVTELLETNASESYENGLRISSNAGYEATFNGVFSGSTAFKFHFPEKVDKMVTKTIKPDGVEKEVQAPNWFGGNFVVRVADASDADNYFEVEYGSATDAWGYSYTSAWVKYNGGYYTSKYYDSETSWFNSKKTGVDTHVAPNFRSYYGMGGGVQDTLEGYLGFAWDNEGKLSVSVKTASSGINRVIATFDGTEAEGFVSGTSWGLPKMNFENGYVISFSSSFDATDADGATVADHATDVTFTEIAGVLLGGEKTDVSYRHTVEFENATVRDTDVYIPQNEPIGNVEHVYTLQYGATWKHTERIPFTETPNTTALGDYAVSANNDAWKETPLGAVEKTYTVHVETPYTLTFDVDGGEAIDAIVHSQNTTERIVVSDAEKLFWNFGGWYIGENEWSGDVSELFGQSVTLTAKWLDVSAPVISLNGEKGVVERSYLVKGASVSITEQDVVAGDAAQNATIRISTEIKTPTASAFTAVQAPYTLQLTDGGEYVVRYTVTDAAGLTAVCERTIATFERSAPSIELTEGYQTKAYIGMEVALATATVKNADGEVLDVVISVVKDGALVESLPNGNLKALALGEYVVTYAAKDKAPYEALQSVLSYTITVSTDDVAPEIGNEFTDMQVKPNTVITIPTITVTDNVSANVSLKTSVYYGTEEIALENGAFTATHEGTYRVVLIAEDESGNKTEKTVSVTVKTETNETDGGGCGSGCGGCGSSGGIGLPMGLLMVAGSFVFGKNVMMKKIKRKENI